tara:strand:+ start:51 stop:1025 length:975 start_codon:yes stop_codon:yes gene_type:complete
VNILLTGGTGFVGRAILRYIGKEIIGRHKNIGVTVITRNPNKFLDIYPDFGGLSWLDFVKGNVLIEDTLPRENQYSHIIHAATEATKSKQIEYLDQYLQILDGTRNILNLAAKGRVSRILFVSSGAAYGKQPGNKKRLKEEYQGALDAEIPSNAYGLGKRDAENLCKLYSKAYGFEVVIARCFAFLGPDLPMDAHYAIGNFIADAIYRESIIIKGNGTALRTYLDQDDMANWLFRLLINGRAGEIYNVGSDKIISIRKLADKVRDLLAPGKNIEVMGSQEKGCNKYIPDIEKINREMGLRVTITLEKAIMKAGEHLIKAGTEAS